MKAPLLLALGLYMAAISAGPCAAPSTGALSYAEQNVLVRQAQAELDTWQGQGVALRDAKEKLQLVLDANPNHVQARIEMARYIVKNGYISYQNVRRDALDDALQQLNLAVKSDPTYADIYVMMGNVYYYMGLPTISLHMLEKAEALGTDNVWLDLNFADAYMATNDWDRAAARLKKWGLRNTNRKNTPPAALTGFYTAQIALYSQTGDKHAVGDAYRSILRLDPGSAWNRGNYAEFLLLVNDDPDGAIVEARKALAIMDYGMARATLGKAQYCKWAQLRKSNSARADSYLAQAQENAPRIETFYARMGAAASAGPNMQRLLLALQDRGFSVDTADEDGDTALTITASGGRVEPARWLLGHGADPHVVRKDGWNALGLATWHGHPEMVHLLVAHGADVNAVVYQSRTPIHFAVRNRDQAMVKTLIALKGNVNFAAPGPETPLMVAAELGDTAIVRLLLAAGADPRIKTFDGKTAADFADSKNHWDTGDVIRGAM